MFKFQGASLALEPVYAVADDSKDLIPAELEEKIVWMGDEVASFAQHTDFGKAYGARFAYVVNSIICCSSKIAAIVSLGSGSGLAEISGLWHRKNLGSSLPFVYLIESNRKNLKRAKLFASTLGVGEHISTIEDFITRDYILPTNQNGVMAISCGLAGNYFTESQLVGLITTLLANKRIDEIHIDFIDPYLTERLKFAIGWPVAENDTQIGVRPRDVSDINRLMSEIEFSNIMAIETLAEGRIHFLKIVPA